MQAVITDQQALANIAANIASLRGARSRYWLAHAVGTYPINITRIENCESMPGSGLLARIAEVLGTTTDALLSQDALKHDGSKKFSRTA